MSKKKIYIIKLCIVLVIIANMLMITIFNSDNEIFSNIFAIIVICFINFWLDFNKDKIDSRSIRPEIWGIMGLTAVSVLRLINRIETVSNSVNSSFTALFIGIGIYILSATIVRLVKKNKNN